MKGGTDLRDCSHAFGTLVFKPWNLSLNLYLNPEPMYKLVFKESARKNWKGV